jgi:hypothetical protein
MSAGASAETWTTRTGGWHSSRAGREPRGSADPIARSRVRVVWRMRKHAQLKEYSPVTTRIRLACTAAAMVPLTVLAVACSSSGSSPGSSASGSAPTSGNTITETGSTLLFPLFGAWQAAYNEEFPDVNIYSAGTGSGTGIANAAFRAVVSPPGG